MTQPLPNPETWQFHLGGNDARGRAVSPFPRPPLSMNDRMHWRKETEIKQQLRLLVVSRLQRARVPKDADHVTVQLLYRPGTSREPDPDNLAKTTKTIADALQPRQEAYVDRKGKGHAAVLGYGLIPNDTARYCSRPEAVILPFAGREAQGWWLRLTIRRTPTDG